MNTLRIVGIPGTHGWELRGDPNGYGREQRLETGSLFGLLHRRVKLERAMGLTGQKAAAAKPRNAPNVGSTPTGSTFLAMDENATVEQVGPCL